MTPARERLVVVAGVAAAGAAAVLAATQTFASATVTGVESPIVVAGQQAAPALAPVGIVALALALALTIAGRFARVVLGVVLVLLGAATVALALPSALDPAFGTAAAISTRTGVTGIEGLVTARSSTGWPVVAVVAGVVAGLLGLVVLVRTNRWTTGGRRFSRTARAVDLTDPIAEWDALSRGTDPTD